MRKFIKPITAGLITGHLIVSFMLFDLNPANWTDDERFMSTMVGAIMGWSYLLLLKIDNN